LAKIIEMEPGMSHAQKLNSLVILPLSFPEEDRLKLEREFTAIRPPFMPI
jgi:hypothetical protein